MVQSVPGKHHTHMEEGAKVISSRIRWFLEGADAGVKPDSVTVKTVIAQSDAL